MKNAYAKSIATLSVICLIIAALLSGINYITEPQIIENEKAATNKALEEVRPGAAPFEPVNLSDYENVPDGVIEAYADNLGGFVVKVESSGYAPGLVVLVGIDEGGKVTGAVCLASGETLGAEKTYGEQFVDVTVDTVDGVSTISGATLTTNAYKNAVKDALAVTNILKGGAE